MEAQDKLSRRRAVARILADRGDMLVVTGLGSPTYDCAAAGDNPLNFYLWGAMGSAVMMGLGLALRHLDGRGHGASLSSLTHVPLLPSDTRGRVGRGVRAP